MGAWWATALPRIAPALRRGRRPGKTTVCNSIALGFGAVVSEDAVCNSVGLGAALGLAGA